jgi:proline dehydrogenase
VEGEKNETGFDDAKEEVLRTINITTNSKSVPFAVFKLTALASFDLLAKVSAKEVLSKDEQAAWSRVVARVDAIYEKANRHNLPVMVDAEETWIQPAIDELTEIKMRKYNSKKALVYTTAQLYRKDRLDYIRALVTRGQTDKFHVGIKLVRGAYMEKERLRAKSMGYASPIQDTKADADRAYDQAVEFCLKNIAQAAICIGTHNEYSCSHAIALMKRFNIEVDDQRVYFSQLYGMSDQLTFNLAEAGYNAAKYLPYGPVEKALPYLFRRAEENTSVGGQSSREVTLLKKEIARRRNL